MHLEHVAYRMGLLAVLRSRVKDGEPHTTRLILIVNQIIFTFSLNNRHSLIYRL